MLGLFLMAHFKGQIVVEDLGFYGRHMHVALVRENRLIAGVSRLNECERKAPELSASLPLIKDRVASGATFKDAEALAELAGLRPDCLREDNNYNRFVDDAMA